MPIGPGKYDDLCSEVRIKVDARAVLLLVIDGSKGNGFSCQADLATTLALPDILERLAKQIRQSGP
jgi:hypothetical protein